MAEPVRKHDFDPPRPAQDPFNPVPPERSDPLGPEPLTTDLDRSDDVVVVNRPGMAGNGLLIAAVIVILAAVAFYIFGPGATEMTAPPPEEPAATAPASPDATAPVAPEATAPADSATQPAPSGEATQPAPSAPAEPVPAPQQ